MCKWQVFHIILEFVQDFGFFLLPASQLAGMRVTNWIPYREVSPILISNSYWDNNIFTWLDYWFNEGVIIKQSSSHLLPHFVNQICYWNIRFISTSQDNLSGFELSTHWPNCLHFFISAVLFQCHAEAAVHAKCVAHAVAVTCPQCFCCYVVSCCLSNTQCSFSASITISVFSFLALIHFYM
jgi:hypothetical protein